MPGDESLEEALLEQLSVEREAMEGAVPAGGAEESSAQSPEDQLTDELTPADMHRKLHHLEQRLGALRSRLSALQSPLPDEQPASASPSAERISEQGEESDDDP